MKRKLFIILFMYGFAIAGAQDQESAAEKYLQFGGGMQGRILLDEQKSALVYTTKQLSGGFEFGSIGNKSVITAEIRAGIGNYTPSDIKGRWLYITTTDIHGVPETDSFPVMSRLISGRLELSYQAKLNRGKKWIWLAGGSLTDHLLYPDNNIGLLNSLGLHFKLGVIKNSHRSRFRSDISFPLLAINSRLPWHNTATSPDASEIKTLFKKGSRLITVDKYRMVEFSLSYDYKLSDKWSIGASYEFGWFHVTYYQPMKSNVNTFLVQTALIF